MTPDPSFSTHAGATAIDSVVESVPFRDRAVARRALEEIHESGIPSDLLESLAENLKDQLSVAGLADRALHYLRRFVAVSRSPQLLVSLFQQDPGALEALLKMFAVSPWLAECLVADPEAFDLMRMTEGQPIDREVLVDEIVAECSLAQTIPQAASILRRYRRRETLRIAYGDLVHDQPLERTGQQLAFVADAILGAALSSAHEWIQRRRGSRIGQALPQVPMAVLATGPYGGHEQNYGDHLEVLLVYDDAAETAPNGGAEEVEARGELAAQWGETLVALLAASDELGPTYLLNQRLRPSDSPALVSGMREVIRYLDLAGRTWHRHALTRARVAAGDADLGQALLDRLEPWIYRRYLGAADLEGLRSIKRNLARRSQSHDDEDRHLERLGHSADDIQDAIHFLQLLNGADLPALRVGATLQAIPRLEQTGCLTMRERTLLSEHYVALRRLQFRFQLAQHSGAPADQWAEPAEAVAAGLGYRDMDGAADVDALRRDALQRRQVCRHIIDHLVHDAFTDSGDIPFETEMVLDPEVDLDAVSSTLRRHGFRDPSAAFDELLSMGREPIPFLSDRRARHFLASIAPALLEEVAATPDPDQTLSRLAAISDSLGGKAALWELFQTTPSALRLCTRLCASSPYLAGILTSNPGMLDELIDSLVLDRLPQGDELEASSRELCRFAEDIDPILHSFKNSAHLRIGVRDVLGRDPIEATHRAIADTAESCLRRLAEDELAYMCDRYGDPLSADGAPAGLTIVALGRLGGREPNYHSDLDVLFLYDHDGQTRPRAGGRREGTSNHHFFNELAQRISKRVNHYGPSGRLYELDGRIRSSSQRGTMAVTIDQFRDHFSDTGTASLWQRLALVPARVIFASPESRDSVEGAIQQVLLDPRWSPAMAAEARQLRYSMQQGAAAENLKRGPGGTMDVEAIVQMLLLAHAGELEGTMGLGTLEGLELLRNRGWISVERAQSLVSSYRYLRGVESNLRLMNLPARHDLPTSAGDLRCLAFAMRETHSSVVVQKCDAYRDINRRLFEAIFAEHSGTATEISV